MFSEAKKERDRVHVFGRRLMLDDVFAQFSPIRIQLAVFEKKGLNVNSELSAIWIK